jgi:hypothetical protein
MIFKYLKQNIAIYCMIRWGLKSSRTLVYFQIKYKLVQSLEKPIGPGHNSSRSL